MARDSDRAERSAHDLRASEAVPDILLGKELLKIRREILMLSDRAKKLADRIDVLITQQGQV